MRFRSLLVLGLVVLAQSSFVSSSAEAGLILSFGQKDGGSPVVGTKVSSSEFDVTATAVPVTITYIDSSSGLTGPIQAYLNLNLKSTGAAVPAYAGAVLLGALQVFDGTFKISANSDGSGFNYLSTDHFNSSIFATLPSIYNGNSVSQAIQLTDTSDTVFKSDAFGAVLSPPSGFALSLGNVYSTGNGIHGVTWDGSSFNSFNANVAGQANATLPEPSSIVAAAIGLAMLAPSMRRRFKKSA